MFKNKWAEVLWVEGCGCVAGFLIRGLVDHWHGWRWNLFLVSDSIACDSARPSLVSRFCLSDFHLRLSDNRRRITIWVVPSSFLCSTDGRAQAPKEKISTKSVKLRPYV